MLMTRSPNASITLKAVAALLAGWLLVLAPVALAQQTEVVGEVSLVLGKAYKVSATGDSEALSRGQSINVGDSISTESNGHVHIRFVDQALVSVRPNSELKIERYDFDPARPELSAVKFRLEEGVTRSISGEAAKRARERFRLNTPIAAIGVRGTDFVVSADTKGTRALVYEGAIVIAPFSDACSMDTLGPCVANSLELEGSQQMLALDQAAPLPRLLPAQSIRNPNMMRQEAQALIAGNQTDNNSVNSSEPEQATDNEVVLEGISTATVTDEASIAATQALSSSFTPDVAITAQDVADRQMVWGRYAFADSVDDRITLSFAEASVGRAVTVGNFDYGLFRPEEDSQQRVNQDLTIVGFELDSAQAFYNSDTGIVAMQVDGGTLDIDFVENRFATELNLQSDPTGAVDFLASGLLFDGGYFRAKDATQSIAGAVSLDGTEAGYFFEQQLEAGNISGLTLWDSR